MTTRPVYLNHAGTSWPKPDVVTRAICEATSVAPYEWPRRFDEAHQAIADFFKISCSDQLLLTPGCTSAIAVGMGDVLIESGQRVLTSSWEHHALHRPLLKMASSGIEVQYIPPESGSASRESRSLVDLTWLEQELSRQNVGLVAITAACNVTGELLPFQQVITLAHRYGAMVLLDAAQIVGWHELDLPQLGADLVAFGGHKGLQGPWGIGGLYCSERAKMECVSATCGVAINSAKESSAIRPGYCDVGSVDQIALWGLQAAIMELSQSQLVENLARGRNQIKRMREPLQEIEGLEIFGGREDGLPTLAFDIPGMSSSVVSVHLAQFGLLVGSGHQCAPIVHESLGTMDSGLVRLSVGIGQPDHEIDEAIERIGLALASENLDQLRKDSVVDSPLNPATNTGE